MARNHTNPHIFLLCIARGSWFHVGINVLENAGGCGEIAVVDERRAKEITSIAIIICNLHVYIIYYIIIVTESLCRNHTKSLSLNNIV